MNQGAGEGAPAAAAGRGAGRLRWPGAELDLRTAQVRVAGVPLALDRSSYEVLLALLLRAGQVVGKDDLLEAGWPGRVVSENSLAKAISRLRRELGELAGAPLQSVHGYGYRWAGEVQWLEAAAGAPPHGEPGAAWVGRPVPGREGWTFTRLLGEGGPCLTLLAESSAGLAPRVVKLAVSEEGLAQVRREVALQRHLAAARRDLRGLAPLLSWRLEEPPFFFEYPYYESGDLPRWMLGQMLRGLLPLDQRLELLAQLAETVGELHAAGVVHQDLRPGNLFLRPEAELPSGWRLVLGGLGGGHATPITLAGERPPEAELLEPTARAEWLRAHHALHLAPEVLAGGIATQRSDLFALGVLLYQMVVGDLRRPLAPGWESEVEDPLLREDIRVLAALRPDERTLGASQLARHLRELPQRHEARCRQAAAEARQRAAEQQLRRQASRLRLLGAATVALVLGLGVAAFAGWLALEARTQERARREEAQAVLAFLTEDVLSRGDPYRGGDRAISLRASLDAAAERIGQRLGDRPATAAAVHLAVAGAYEAWGAYARAAAHQREAIAALETASATEGAEQAVHYRRLCHLERQAGRLVEATEACDRGDALELAARGRVSDAGRVERAKLDHAAGRCGAAVDALRPLVDARVRREPLPPAAEAEAYWFLGLCQSRLGEDAAAVASFRALVARQEERFGMEHPSTAWALADFAEALARSGRLVEAEAVLDRMESVVLARLGPEHPDTLAVAYRRGLVALARGDEAEAARQFTHAHRGWAATLGRDHAWTLLAGSELARAQARLGERRGAERLLAELRFAAEPLLAEQPGRALDLHELWAQALLALGRLPEAQRELEAFEILARRELPEAHPRRAIAQCVRSRLAMAVGAFSQAGAALNACRTGLARLPPGDFRRRFLAEAERAIDAEGHRPLAGGPIAGH
ncbi:winged helix-turn-helix domain-containing protein [Silanimonas lenta]|uniref:winged helix-turn-helix domain-containing protein n=1 Tax=Silanimonas lenta TaxID=265429 RepID=UPI000A07A232|nr:winged helix-turn-helix domain-containing protein [Silanimonas lenta]